MATQRHVILVCDQCGTEDKSAMVETHRVSVDGTARDAEVCAGCWQKLMEIFTAFACGGREPEKRKVKKADLLEWPDTPWKFSKHAVLRMGERGVSPAAVLRVLADQDIRRPGKFDGEEIWQRGNVKIVVNPEKQYIVTTSKTDEPDRLAAVS